MAMGRQMRILVVATCYILACFMITPFFAPSYADSSDPVYEEQINAGTTVSAITVKTPDQAGADEESGTKALSGAAISATASTSSAALEVDEDAPATTPGALNADVADDDDSLWYRSEIPMIKEHQKLLWDHCRERGLDYIDMLALISLESNFNEKCSSKKCKGYFQISSVHHKNLSKTLKTENNPLDGAISINWGTAMYSWILADKLVRDLEGKEQRDVALSIYQRGSGGYKKYGLNKSYLKKYYKKRDKIAPLFESEEIQ